MVSNDLLTHRPGQLMTEHLIQLRYTLRLRVLHHAAFQGVMHYDPKETLAKLTHRLFDVYQDGYCLPGTQQAPSCQHIERLNAIGQSIVANHNGPRQHHFPEVMP